jgi:acyl-CoA thioesterase I
MRSLRFALALVAGVALGCSSTPRDAAADSTRGPASVAASESTSAPLAAPPSVQAAAAAVPAEQTSSRKRILFVGTSLTAGYGLSPDDAFTALIQQKVDSAKLPYEVINAGVSGETTNGLLSRLDGLLRDDFDVVVLESGANDGLRGVPIETVKGDLQTAIDRIKQARPNARIVLAQMEALPNYGPQYTRAFHNIYPDLAKANGVRVLPFLLDGVAGHAELNQADGIHPNQRGERIVADNVWRGLRPLLRSGA